MEKHEEKVCPICGDSFICKTGDVANCQYSLVDLSEDTRIFLSKTCFDCLCNHCLCKINEDVRVSRRYCFPTQKEMLIEGLHYYKEGDNWIFTALYHQLRGYCCGAHCRHCIYGFNKPQDSTL